MDDARLAAFVRSQINDAIGYDQTEHSLRRVRAIEYYRGELRDLDARDGWSKVTTRDLSDHVGWILPSLMRVFASSDQVVCYEPQGPEDEGVDKQASDYVNYVFWRECSGYRVLWDAFQDALMFGNGVFKFWWDASPKHELLDYTGLSDDAFTQLVSDDEVSVLQHRQEIKTERVPDPQTGQPVEQPYTCHDVKIRRVSESGRLRIMCLAPEEFLIERGATSIEDAKFACHRSRRTRQSLIDDGYDRETVLSIGADYDLQSTPERVARWNRVLYDQNHFHSDPLMVEVDVFEAYLRVDHDGDGHAEWRKVVIAGTTGDERQLLANDEWSDDLPFADVVPNPDAHIWRGRSMMDELEDVQKIKTTLQRQTLDNLYLSNLPQREVVLKNVSNPDEVVNPTPGGVIQVSQLGQIREVQTPFVAAESYQMLEYQDMVAEKRTGVSRQSMALDPEALSNQTATGQMLAQSASYSKIELYARNIAEIGLKRLFRCVLKLIVRYQDRPKMVRLRNNWVQMDPRAWNANMDATVSVGLGSGSRDRDMMLLMQIAGKQEQIIAQAGPMNPICNLAQYANTLRKMVEASGLKEPDQFFSEVSSRTVQQFVQQQDRQDQPQPDPRAQAEMARMQIEQQKLQLEQQRAQAGAELDRQKAQSQVQAMREKAMLELQLARERSAEEMRLAEERAEFEREQRKMDAILDAQLRREEMLLEAELTREANQMNSAVTARPADTNIDTPAETGM
ncbi:hypothetical protein MesoLjLc_22010 [Mesorhizobium sp. L-8-10]|uniref:portal protein n=1 Tax=Mesorhizobium sp. L-8-10 TaxID=2744523 RepID=UPI001927699C|nr:hypothetical protein [Mesorhizobium sp. L-8-10]BCH30271.1 hypothetical protein MesoLjLc_22010 [Mesorhizobium sp. L-8-10]